MSSSDIKLVNFSSDMLQLLFRGIPEFPYDLIFDEWSSFKEFLIERGIQEYLIPKSMPVILESKGKVKEIDFVIQVIIAEVLRKVSIALKSYDFIDINDTERYAVRYFISFADEYFSFRKDLYQTTVNVHSLFNFAQLSEVIQGEYAQILKGACQRLDFIYRKDINIRKRSQSKEKEKRIFPKEIKRETSRKEKSATSVLKEEVIVEEKFIEQVFNTISGNQNLHDMIERVNLKLDNDNKITLQLEEEDTGVFSLGNTKIDARSILLRISSMMKPQAKLLLRFLISKIQPDKVNLIELNYEQGMMEFEAAMMLQDGYLPKKIHGAIDDCNPDTTFPKVVAVCTNILEEVLGKEVTIWFTKRGDVVIELRELEEKKSRNLMAELINRIEHAIIQKEKLQSEKSIELDDDPFKEIGLLVEAEAEKADLEPESPSLDYDDLLDAELMKLAEDIESQLTHKETEKTEPKSPKPVGLKSSEAFALIEPILSDPHEITKPREITAAILAGVKRYSDDHTASKQLNTFIKILSQITRDYCGEELGIIYPDLLQADDFVDMARRLNQTIDAHRAVTLKNDAMDTLLRGALLAVNYIKLGV